MFRYLLLFSLVALTASACTSTGRQVATEVSPTGTEAPPYASASVPTTVPTNTVTVMLSSTSKPTRISIPTSIPSPTGTLSPSLLPTFTKEPTPTALKLGGPDVFYNGISFTVDPILGEVVFMRKESGLVDYTKFSFALEGCSREVGCVIVVPVEVYRDHPYGGDYIIDELQAAIETGSYHYFPTVAAAILLRAQTQHIRFQNGAGIRAIVMRGQNGYLANNEAVVYDFHGLTDDGQYYVKVTFPIDAPMLLSTYDPKENTNEGAFLVPELPDGPPFGYLSFLEYNREAERQLDVLEGARFIPDLGLLDALVGSLLVTSSSGE